MDILSTLSTSGNFKVRTKQSWCMHHDYCCRLVFYSYWSRYFPLPYPLPPQAVLDPKIWNPSFTLHDSRPPSSTTSHFTSSSSSSSYTLASQRTLTFVFSFLSSFGPSVPILFDFGDGTKFRYLGKNSRETRRRRMMKKQGRTPGVSRS